MPIARLQHDRHPGGSLQCSQEGGQVGDVVGDVGAQGDVVATRLGRHPGPGALHDPGLDPGRVDLGTQRRRHRRDVLHRRQRMAPGGNGNRGAAGPGADVEQRPAPRKQADHRRVVGVAGMAASAARRRRYRSADQQYGESGTATGRSRRQGPGLQVLPPAGGGAHDTPGPAMPGIVPPGPDPKAGEEVRRCGRGVDSREGQDERLPAEGPAADVLGDGEEPSRLGDLSAMGHDRRPLAVEPGGHVEVGGDVLFHRPGVGFDLGLLGRDLPGLGGQAAALPGALPGPGDPVELGRLPRLFAVLQGEAAHVGRAEERPRCPPGAPGGGLGARSRRKRRRRSSPQGDTAGPACTRRPTASMKWARQKASGWSFSAVPAMPESTR